MPQDSKREIRSVRAELSKTRRLVVKVGSRLIAESPAGRPAAIADQIAQLRTKGVEVILVCSGAISLGIRTLGLSSRPQQLPMLQAAAAIGQGQLLQKWEHAFATHSITIGQILLTHDDIANRRRFLNARHAVSCLLQRQIVPIINENDTVAVDEIKYGDNDLIAALVCNLTSADSLLLLTDVDGLHDHDNQRVAVVHDIDNEAAPIAKPAQTDGVGSGGMASKVQAAKVAVRSGIPTLVANGRAPTVLADFLAGHDVGTLFVPETPMNSRKHWIAFATRTRGTVVVDTGAHSALTNQGGSLLPAGISDVRGEFELGDIISLENLQGVEFARGLAGYRASDMRRIKGLQTTDIRPTLGYKYFDEVVHRDDLVLL